MASFVARGQFAARTGTGLQAVSGLGFQPKAVILTTSGLTANGNLSTTSAWNIYGISTGPGASYCVTTMLSSGGSVVESGIAATALEILTIFAGDGNRALMDSFDSDGFTLNWTLNDHAQGPSAGILIDYIAFGGDDLDAAIKIWQLPSVTGSHSETGVGFQPDLLFNIYSTFGTDTIPSTASGITGTAGWGIGAADANGNQFATFASTNVSTRTCMLRTNRSIVNTNTGGAARVDVSHTSMDADGFTVNMLAASGTYDNQIMTLALVGLDAAVGNFVRSTSTDNVISGLGFQPDVLLNASAYTGSSGSTPSSYIGHAVGISDATTDTVRLLTYVNNDPNSYRDTGMLHAGQSGGAIVDKTGLASMDADGFTTSWISGTGAHLIGYLALAGTGAVATSLDADALLEPVASGAIQQTHNLTATATLEPVATLATLEVPVTLAADALLELTASGTLSVSAALLLAADALLEFEATATIQQTHNLAADALLELTAVGDLLVEDITVLHAAAFMEVTATGAIQQIHEYDASTLLELTVSGAIQQDHNIRAAALLELFVSDGYVGPGTGLTIGAPADPLDLLREGDTFRVFLPWGGLSGVNALAHVMARTVRDDRDDQQLGLAIVPTPDPATVPRQAGGATPTPGADGTDLARTVSRQGREQDRIERNRNRR